MKSNAEHMSPSGYLNWNHNKDFIFKEYNLVAGKVPFIRANDIIVAELENIVKFVNEKVSMSND